MPVGNHVPLLAAMAGGRDADCNPQGQEQITPTTQSYSLDGAAAVGAALQNCTVIIFDVDGKQDTATIDPVSGIFQVTALQALAPFVLQAVSSTAGQTVTLHSAILEAPKFAQVLPLTVSA